MAIIQKFGRLNITAPIAGNDLPKAIKELKDMKLAFLLVGDEEKEATKKKFVDSCRKHKNVPEPVIPRKLSGNEEESKEEEEKPVESGPTEDMRKLVRKIAEIKRKEKQTQQTQMRKGGRRRGEDEDDIEEFGEEGMDIDTYEARYADRPKPEFDEEEV